MLWCTTSVAAALFTWGRGASELLTSWLTQALATWNRDPPYCFALLVGALAYVWLYVGLLITDATLEVACFGLLYQTMVLVDIGMEMWCKRPVILTR